MKNLDELLAMFESNAVAQKLILLGYLTGLDRIVVMIGEEGNEIKKKRETISE